LNRILHKCSVTARTTTSYERRTPHCILLLQFVSILVRHVPFLCDFQMYCGQFPVSMVSQCVNHWTFWKCLKKYEIWYSLVSFLDRIKHPVTISNRGQFLVAQHMEKLSGKFYIPYCTVFLELKVPEPIHAFLSSYTHTHTHTYTPPHT
jgi:hypothetical protein